MFSKNCLSTPFPYFLLRIILIYGIKMKKKKKHANNDVEGFSPGESIVSAFFTTFSSWPSASKTRSTFYHILTSCFYMSKKIPHKCESHLWIDSAVIRRARRSTHHLNYCTVCMQKIFDFL
jgi:hypothetical protein